MKFCRITLFLLLLLSALQAKATDELAQANNPLANMQAFNMQNYYDSKISGFPQTGDTFWLRYAQPILQCSAQVNGKQVWQQSISMRIQPKFNTVVLSPIKLTLLALKIELIPAFWQYNPLEFYNSLTDFT